MWEILRDNLNAETHCQYWGIGIYVLKCNAIFFTLILLKERQSFVISVTVDILTGIVGIDYTYYSLLYFTLPSAFRFTHPIFGSSY